MSSISKYKIYIVLLLLGFLLTGVGVFIRSDIKQPSYVEVLSENDQDVDSAGIIVVEIAGAVEKPGVYELESGSRVNDLIVLAGGLFNENKEWVEKYINKAAVLKDGQKIIIYDNDYQTENESDNFLSADSLNQSPPGETQNKRVNINTASQSELESLWGIGPVYAKNIIEQRPYSSVEEILEKNIIKSNVYDRNKDLMTIY